MDPPAVANLVREIQELNRNSDQYDTGGNNRHTTDDAYTVLIYEGGYWTEIVAQFDYKVITKQDYVHAPSTFHIDHLYDVDPSSARQQVFQGFYR